MSGYQTLAGYYDRLMETDYEALADKLLALFRQYGSAPHTLLDLACGSGSLTAALIRRGMDMTGVDGSADMLAEAAGKTGGQALLLCQDMRELDLYDTVDGAICTLDSLNHLCRTADIAAVFSRLRLFVAPGGLLIFDVNTPYKHREVLGDNAFILERDGLLCAWQSRLLPRTCEVSMWLDFFEQQPDGRYLRTADSVRERAYSLPTWKALLDDAQFALLAVLDADTMCPPVETTVRWLMVAKNNRPAEDFVNI